MIKIDKKDLELKKILLEKTRIYLKKEFVGIDYVIDELIDLITVWFVMPQVLTRPLIINLWGMTGVGKTDLIRKLITQIEFQERFMEIELSNNSNSYYSTVARHLQNYGLVDGNPSVILFDEIQKFASIDADGKMIVNTQFQDFWELLSDGRVSRKESRTEIDSYLKTMMFNSSKKNYKDNNLKEGEINNDDYELNYWDLERAEQFFNLDIDMDVASGMKQSDLNNMLKSQIGNKKNYEPYNLSQSLIFICGNLDDAYSVARSTSNADLDADIFYELTSKINIIDVKNTLTKVFRPEQVARFGNTHLIYRSLSENSYRQMIELRLTKIIAKQKEIFGITITVDKTVKELIYNNGVFPVQGVRPLFSTITEIVEVNLANIVFNCLMADIKKVNVTYDNSKKLILATNGKTELYSSKYSGKLDKIRNEANIDLVSMISVHEAGHGVAYSVLFGLAPLQLKSKITSTTIGGFTFPHFINPSKDNIINRIKVLLAGGLAEELVFGAQKASTGRISDRIETTRLATEYMLADGFGDYDGWYDRDNRSALTPNQKQFDSIEAMIKNLVEETNTLLLANKDYLIDLSKELDKEGNLNPDQIITVAKRYKLKLINKEQDSIHIDNYKKLLNK
jgi:Peptidase family M41/ATPase family associated with various cellular activities (AAA)/C-terminal, D2-small domain, of ClpB protein